jgi:hypothetical protein
MENFHSMELRGPILPHAVQNLCSLLDESLDEFSATFANLESTRPFSLVTNVSVDNPERSESVGKFNYKLTLFFCIIYSRFNCL